MRAIEAYARWIIRHRRSVLVGVAVVTVLLANAARGLHVDVDADRQLPQDHPYVQTLNEVYRLFGDKNLVVVGLFPHDRDVFTPAFLAKLIRVTDRIRRVPGANKSLVQSLAAPHVKVIRGTADGVDIDPIIPAPPADAAAAAAVRERVYRDGTYVGTLVSRDGSAAAIQATFELTPATPGYRELHAAVLAALAAEADGTFDYKLSGPVVFLSELSTYSSRMAYLFPLALLVIGLIHYDAFRTLQGLFLPIVTALLSVLWALGLMGLLGVPLDPLNTTTPILILAVAAGHAVQVLKRFYEEYERVGNVEQAVTACLVRVGPVMLAAGLVAALSFFSLITFGTQTIRTFGVFTGFGILSALAVELTIIPAVRVMLPPPRAAERAEETHSRRLLDGFLAFVGRLARTHSRAVMVSALLLVAASAALASRIEINMSLKGQFRAEDPVRLQDASINQQFAGTNTLLLLVQGEGEGALEDPAVIAAIDRVERMLEQEPGVGKVMSYVDLLRTMHRAMNADQPDVGELPATRALAAQYLFLYGLSASEQLDTMLDPTHRSAKVRVLTREDSTHYGEHLIGVVSDAIRRDFPPGYRVGFTGTLANSVAATQVMVTGKIRNILQIALITIVISSLLLRSLLGGLLVALPLAVAVAVNFGVMGLLRIPLDSLTSAISAMAVGIGADYAMYLLFRVREERRRTADLFAAIDRSLATSGKAIFFVSTAIALGYATLCLSGFGLHVHLGALVALAMVVSSGSAVVVLPSVIVAMRPRFLERDTDDARRRSGKEDAARMTA